MSSNFFALKKVYINNLPGFGEIDLDLTTNDPFTSTNSNLKKILINYCEDLTVSKGKLKNYFSFFKFMSFIQNDKKFKMFCKKYFSNLKNIVVLNLNFSYKDEDFNYVLNINKEGYLLQKIFVDGFLVAETDDNFFINEDCFLEGVEETSCFYYINALTEFTEYFINVKHISSTIDIDTIIGDELEPSLEQKSVDLEEINSIFNTISPVQMEVIYDASSDTIYYKDENDYDIYILDAPYEIKLYFAVAYLIYKAKNDEESQLLILDYLDTQDFSFWDKLINLILDNDSNMQFLTSTHSSTLTFKQLFPDNFDKITNKLIQL